jgi:uncharacterized membrane protein YqhA
MKILGDRSMISYEKVKQSFRSFTIVNIVLNAILTVLYIFGIFGIFIIKMNLDNPEFTALYTEEQLAALKSSVTPFAIFTTVLYIAIAIAIIVLSAINLSKAKKDLELSYIPHFMGTAIAVFNIIFSFTNGFSLTTILMQSAFIALYFYTYTRAKTLNNREIEE